MKATKIEHEFTSNPIAAYSPNIEDFARPVNKRNIHLSEHWGVVGSTGSGKTVFTVKGLLEYLRQQFPEVPRYILNSTDDPKLLNMVFNPIEVTGNHVPDLMRTSQYTQVWTPDNSKIPLQYAEWFSRFNDSRSPAIIVIDEIDSVTSKALPALESLFKQMRKHNGTVIAESQRIAKVSTDIFSQLTHFVQMFINPEQYDLMKARDYLHVPKEEQRPPLGQFGGFYRHTRNRQPYQEFSDYQHFFGGA